MNLPFKFLMVLILGLIVFSLAEAMYYLAKDSGRTDRVRVVKALTLRIVLSLVLFALLLGGSAIGLIGPSH